MRTKTELLVTEINKELESMPQRDKTPTDMLTDEELLEAFALMDKGEEETLLRFCTWVLDINSRLETTET